MKGSGGVGRGGGVGGRGARRGERGERLLLPLCSAHEEGVMTNYLHEKAHKSLGDDRAEGAAVWLEKNGRKTKGHKHSDRWTIVHIPDPPDSLLPMFCVFMWNKNLQYTRNSHNFSQFHTLCNQFSRNALISFRVQELCCNAIFWGKKIQGMCWLTTGNVSLFTRQFLPPVEHVLQSRLQLVRKDGVLIIQLGQSRRRCKYAQHNEFGWHLGEPLTMWEPMLILPVGGSGCCQGQPPGPTGRSRETVMSFPDKRFVAVHMCCS